MADYYITSVEDTLANFHSDAGHGQRAVLMDNDEMWAWKNDDDSKTIIGAAQGWTTDGSSFAGYYDLDFGELTLHDDLLVDEYMKRSGGTDDYIRMEDDTFTFALTGSTVMSMTGGKMSLASGTGINEFSTDGTLAGDSDDAVPTEKAVKTYVDGISIGVDTFLELTDTISGYHTGRILFETDSAVTDSGHLNWDESNYTLYVGGTQEESKIIIGYSSEPISYDWFNNLKAIIQLYSASGIYANATDITFAQNSYSANTVGTSRMVYGESTSYVQSNGVHTWFADGNASPGNYTPTEKLRLSSSDLSTTQSTLSIGKSTIENWVNTQTALQLGGTCALMATTSEATSGGIALIYNAYYDSTSNWKRIRTEETSRLNIGGGNFVFYSDASGTLDTNFTPTERIKIGSSDLSTAQTTLSINKTTIENWDTAYAIIQLGGNAAFLAETTEAVAGQLSIVQNAYYDGAWDYISTNEATQYIQGSGDHEFFSATSGTADTNITFQSMLKMSRTLTDFNNSALKRDFRIQSDNNAHMLFIDSSEDCIGINMNNPDSSYALNINGDVKLEASFGIHLDNITAVTGDIELLSNVDTNNKNIYSGNIDLADDAATSFTPGQEDGMIIIACQETSISAIVTYSLGSGTAYTVLNSGSSNNFEVTTGVLTGTDGTDGKFTISYHTDGKIYLENRMGGT